MKFIAILTAFAFVAVAQAQAQQYTQCNAGYTDLTINSLTWTPSPACIGQKLCATANVTLKAPIIQGATFSMIGRYLNKIIYTDNQDLCSMLAAAGTPCPVPATTTTLTACTNVKTSAPANIPCVMTTSARNGNGNGLFCIAVNGAKGSNCNATA